ncbi:tRNA methyltransferase [Clostridium novyi A str. 4570]|uniref:Putative tRNA (cytidine(34)-2'-O)-methyltransferase n=1 Tax=Clostridium novyi A str. 4570 TaxID=1444290 RepID=A0AA88ZSK4_CLONO|nr:tRNA (uridine(34)/cytosine(34)/5-carboxymethylaminomethyluridine(34)-2'-O)-methyltransferase TrmL [Clostridium novyi]KGN03246.1 tRNA methyltransferase [Clostridium novyi A str. 4570]
MLDTPNLNIVLFEPEIPQNTGNIGRTCVLTNSKLHLIKPLGFRIDDKSLKRAGLDYWPHLDVEVHESFDDMIKKYPDANIYLSTTKEAKYHHDEVKYKTGDFIVFGRESSGLPEYIRDKYVENRIRVPMIKTTTRSLNLSNTVSIVAYEALRQLGFPDMK